MRTWIGDEVRIVGDSSIHKNTSQRNRGKAPAAKSEQEPQELHRHLKVGLKDLNDVSQQQQQVLKLTGGGFASCRETARKEFPLSGG